MTKVKERQTEHLGTSSELLWFAMNMAEQLEKHQNEKSPLREWECRDVKQLVIDEIKIRLAIIEKLDVEDSEDLKIFCKQFTHISNYSMMGFLRGKYNV